MVYRTPSSELPAVERPASMEAVPTELMGPEPAISYRPEEKPTRTGPVRVLVADDEKRLRNMYSRMLKALKCKVDTSETATDAWDLYQQKDYDIVLTDMHMETYDAGLVLWDLIHSTDDPADTLIISGGMSDDVRAKTDARKAKVLSKPFSIQMLEEIVNNHK